MTTDLEKQFFSTFGIEPRACIASCSKCQHYSYDYCLSGYCTLDSDYDNCGVAEKQYPQIGDSILLELICMLSEWRTYLHSDYTVKADNVSSLKEYILKDFLELFKWYEFKKCEKGIKQQVQALFKE